MTMTSKPAAATFHCPSWCAVSTDVHAAEAPEWEGGSIHWSEDFEGEDDCYTIRVGLYTDKDGGWPDQHPGISMRRSDDMTVKQVRRFAIDLLRAAELMEDAG